jgi:hypothetical protein
MTYEKERQNLFNSIGRERLKLENLLKSIPEVVAQQEKLDKARKKFDQLVWTEAFRPKT